MSEVGVFLISWLVASVVVGVFLFAYRRNKRFQSKVNRNLLVTVTILAYLSAGAGLFTMLVLLK